MARRLFMDNNQNMDWKVNEYNDQPANEAKPEPPKGKAIRSMVFGIIAIYCSMIPIFSIVGIVFGALAKKWAAPIIENYPYTSARLFAKAGHITGKIGLILGIVFTAIYFFAFFVGIVAGIVSAAVIASALIF